MDTNADMETPKKNLVYVQCAASGLAFPVFSSTHEPKQDVYLSLHSLSSIAYLLDHEDASWAKTFFVRLPNGQLMPYTYSDLTEDQYGQFNHGGVYDSTAAAEAKKDGTVKVTGEVLREAEVASQGSPSARVERSALDDDQIMSAYNKSKDAVYTDDYFA